MFVAACVCVHQRGILQLRHPSLADLPVNQAASSVKGRGMSAPPTCSPPVQRAPSLPAIVITTALIFVVYNLSSAGLASQFVSVMTRSITNHMTAEHQNFKEVRRRDKLFFSP